MILPLLAALLAVFPALLTPHAAAAPGVLLEGVVRDQAGNPVPDAVVYLPDAAPILARGAGARPAVMDQVNRSFVPSVLTVRVGTAVRFPNSEAIHHSVYSFSRSKRFEIGLFKGQGGAVTFDRPGEVRIFCAIHKRMAGLIVVTDHPYAAVTDAQGRFVLTQVPPGEHPVRAVHVFASGVTRPVVVGSQPARADFQLKVVRPPKAQEGSYY